MRNVTMVNFISILALFSAVPAFAAFNGTWTGTDGAVAGTHNGACSPIQFHITQTDTSLTTESSAYTCENGYSESAISFTFDIVGTTLMLQGQAVGTITPTTFTYTLVGTDSSGTPLATGTWTFAIDGNNFIYSEGYAALNGGTHDQVLSHLIQQP